MADNTGGGPMLDRLLYDEPAPMCAITDCTIPPVDEHCEVHGG